MRPDSAAGFDPRFADGAILGGEEGDYLLNGDAVLWVDIYRHFVSDVARLLHGASLGTGRLSGEPYPRPRSLCYTDLRLGGTSRQGNCFMIDGIDPDVFQVVIVEVPVPCYPGVDHPAIETRAHREPTRPILRGDNRLETGHMRISHADQPTLHDSGDSSLLVSDADHSAQGRLSKVQVLLVLEDLQCAGIEPRPVANAKA